MSELDKYESYAKKLQGVCDENGLVFRFRRDYYPATLTISPTGGIEGQQTMLEQSDEKGYTSPDANLVFAFKDGVLTYRTSKTFTIGDALFNKLKNLYKNMHTAWLQFFFRDVIEKKLLTGANLPHIDEESGKKISSDEIEEDEELECADPSGEGEEVTEEAFDDEGDPDYEDEIVETFERSGAADDPGDVDGDGYEYEKAETAV